MLYKLLIQININSSQPTYFLSIFAYQILRNNYVQSSEKHLHPAYCSLENNRTICFTNIQYKIGIKFKNKRCLIFELTKQIKVVTQYLVN